MKLTGVQRLDPTRTARSCFHPSDKSHWDERGHRVFMTRTTGKQFSKAVITSFVSGERRRATPFACQPNHTGVALSWLPRSACSCSSSSGSSRLLTKLSWWRECLMRGAIVSSLTEVVQQRVREQATLQDVAVIVRSTT